MSDSTITALQNYTTPQLTDVFPIVDNTGAPVTKKVSISTLDLRWLVNPITTLGDIIYGGASGAVTRLPGNTSATQKFLAQTGTGVASAAPSWQAIDLSVFVPYTGGTQDLQLPNNQIFMDNLLVGDQGFEGDHITVAGNTYTAAAKISDLNASHPADLLFHRHSTSTPALLIIARSNSDTSSHTQLTNSQIIFSLIGVGTAGSDYKQFGQIEIGADDTGGISQTSSPGKIDFKVTPNGSIVPVAALTIHNDLSAIFSGNISANNLSGTNTGDNAANSQYSGLAASKMNALTPTAVKTSNYPAVAGDLIPCDVSGSGFTITLPTAPANMTMIEIKIIKTGGTGNTLTVVTGGTDVFNIAGGNTTVYMNLLSEVQMLQYNSGIWYNVLTAAPSNFATNFPGIDATTPITEANISINYTTRVLTVTPPLGFFRFFVDGGGIITRFVKIGAVTFPAFTDTSGTWFFYFNSLGVATVSQTDPEDFLPNVCTIYSLIWNSTLVGSAKAVVEQIEYHQNLIPAVDHEWKHLYGAVWDNGFTIADNVLTSGAPNADGRNAVVALTTGTNIDDDFKYTITNSTGGLTWQQDLGNTSPAALNATNSGQFQVRYQDGSGQSFILPATRFPFDFDSVTNLPNYITFTGTRTAVPTGDFFVYYVYASQDSRNGSAIKVVSSGNHYNTLTLAQASSWSDIVNSMTTFSDEIRPLYKLIFLYSNTYNIGTKKTVLRQVDDLRKTSIPQLTNTAGSLPASSVTNVPAGTITSTNVQSALNELDTNKVPTTGAVQVVFTSNAITASGNAATVPVTNQLNTITNDSAATLTITMTVASAVDGQVSLVRILDATGVSQTIAWINTENSTVSVPTTSNGSTTLFLFVEFIFNGLTGKWRCIRVC